MQHAHVQNRMNAHALTHQAGAASAAGMHKRFFPEHTYTDMLQGGLSEMPEYASNLLQQF